MHIFSGKHKNRTIQAPKGLQVRPTSGRLREAVFNICQAYIEGALFLDVFAGSGAMGLEALSRGAAQATFIDSSKESIRHIQANIIDLGEEEHTKVLCGNAFLMLEKLEKQGQQFDIIYLDPPYDSFLQYSTKILSMIDSSKILKPNGVLFIEDSTASIPRTEGLVTLILKSSRNMGRSALHQYLRKAN